MKKDKKMMALNHRLDAMMKKSDDMSHTLSLKIAEEITGKDSAMVALYALAKTLLNVVVAQTAAGYHDPMGKFITLLEIETEARAMMKNFDKEND